MPAPYSLCFLAVKVNDKSRGFNVMWFEGGFRGRCVFSQELAPDSSLTVGGKYVVCTMVAVSPHPRLTLRRALRKMRNPYTRLQSQPTSSLLDEHQRQQTNNDERLELERLKCLQTGSNSHITFSEHSIQLTFPHPEEKCEILLPRSLSKHPRTVWLSNAVEHTILLKQHNRRRHRIETYCHII
jgi:hypothetical protein